MTDLPTARHLAAITREAAARAYEADSGVAGKITTWLATVLTTLHAGGLLAAIQSPQKLDRPTDCQTALLIGLVTTIIGAIAGMIHYNSLADRWRQEMHMEIEGSVEISAAAKAHQERAEHADVAATTFIVISIACLAAAGALAI